MDTEIFLTSVTCGSRACSRWWWRLQHGCRL